MMSAWNRDVQRSLHLAASPVLDGFQGSVAARVADMLPKMELPKMLENQTFAAVSKGFDTSRLMRELTASPVLDQLRSSVAAGVADRLAKVELPTVLENQTFAAVSKGFDTSRLMRELTASPVLDQLRKSLAAELKLIGDSPFVELGGDLLASRSMDALLTELRSVIDEVDDRQWGDVDASNAQTIDDGLSMIGGLTGGDVTILFVMVLAAVMAASPAAADKIMCFAREMLESAVFAGAATRGAYVEVATLLPDDNLLGWIAALAWVLRWLKSGPSDRDGG